MRIKMENLKVKIDEIYIPITFKNPKKKKLQERIAFYEKNAEYKVPIVVTENNKGYELIDGYTSYLVAKFYGYSKV